MESKKIIVSDLFVEIYENFNVSSQIDNMNLLNKKELYLLITLCLDKHDDSDPVTSFNFKSRPKEYMEIFDVQDDKESNVDVLNELIEETGDKYIDTDIIVDQKGNKMIEPLNRDQIRDIKINNIISD